MDRLTLDVSKWHIYQHREARGLDGATEDDGREVQIQDEVFERLYAGDEDLTRLAPEMQGEHAAWGQRLHDAASGLPDFTRLSSVVRGDADAAACATETLSALLEPMMRQQEEQAKRPPRPGQKPADLDGQLRRAVRGACAAAAKAVEEYRDAVEAFHGIAPGRSGNEAGQGGNRTRYRDLANAIRGNGRLRHILQLAGRMKRIAAQKQRERVDIGCEEITDVEQGADLGRLLPAELARLWHPKLKLAFLRDWTERQCLQYQLRGVEERGKGPIVVLLDKSGSMDGERDEWATAIALALLSVAQKEKRTFALLCYRADVTFEAVVPAGESLPLDALFVGCGGGTRTDVAVNRALQIIAGHPGQIKQADVIVVSDGDDECEDAGLKVRQRELGVTTFGIGIGGCAGQLGAWCDHTINAYDMTTADDATASAVFTV